MRQVGMAGAGGPSVLRIESAPTPVPKAHEVLIEVYAAGVNRPDLAQREGRYPPPPGASPVLGLEVAGVVVARGSAVDAVRIGEPVCALVPGGGYAEFCVVPATHCLPVPKGLSMIEAAGIPETAFTVWANVFQIGQLTSGGKGRESLLVHGGTSGIGTTAIQFARAFGAEAFATAGSDEKCAECLKLGAKAAINYRTASFEKEIARLTEGRGVDVVLDMVGGEYTERNVECAAFGGRIVQIATQKGAMASVSLVKIMQKRLTITGSTMRPRTIDEKARIARELGENVWPLYASGLVRVIVDRVFDLEDVARAHEHLEAGQHVGKVVLRVKRSV